MNKICLFQIDINNYLWQQYPEVKILFVYFFDKSLQKSFHGLQRNFNYPRALPR